LFYSFDYEFVKQSTSFFKLKHNSLQVYSVLLDAVSFLAIKLRQLTLPLFTLLLKIKNRLYTVNRANLDRKSFAKDKLLFFCYFNNAIQRIKPHLLLSSRKLITTIKRKYKKINAIIIANFLSEINFAKCGVDKAV